MFSGYEKELLIPCRLHPYHLVLIGCIQTVYLHTCLFYHPVDLRTFAHKIAQHLHVFSPTEALYVVNISYYLLVYFKTTHLAASSLTLEIVLSISLYFPPFLLYLLLSILSALSTTMIFIP